MTGGVTSGDAKYLVNQKGIFYASETEARLRT